LGAEFRKCSAYKAKYGAGGATTTSVDPFERLAKPLAMALINSRPSFINFWLFQFPATIFRMTFVADVVNSLQRWGMRA
jgi:hypothetical protein